MLGSFGLRGQVKVCVYVEELRLIHKTKVFFISKFLLERKVNFHKRIKKSIWIASINQIENKEQAEKLKGDLIFLEKKYLPSLMADEFYYEDLKGLKIKIVGSMQKGFIKDIYNFGSGDILEVSLDDIAVTRYIPFDKDNVSEIDLAKKTITLTPLKGLLD